MPRWAWFGAWVLVGASAALALISFVLPLFVIPVGLFLLLMFVWPGSRRSAFGAISGAGFLFLYIAYRWRDGPGTRCTSLPAGGERCTQYLNPLPWLAIGILLVGAGVVAQLLASRRSA